MLMPCLHAHIVSLQLWGLWESIVTRFIGGLCKALKRPYREAILFIGVNATFSKRDRCIFVHRVDIA